MNAGIVIKIEYKIDGASSYTELTYSGFSAKYTTDARKSRAGYSYHLKLNCKIPKLQKTTSDTLSALIGKKLNIKFQDANGNYHYAGNASYPARLIFDEAIGGNAGDFNGYEVTFTQDSPIMHTIATS
jgi:hypothetical protein